MKKLLLAAIGATGLLASCGNASVGDASVELTGIKTEYRTVGGTYVACDETSAGSSKTQVGVYFTAQGTISSVDIALKGKTTSQYDSNYMTNVTGAKLASIGGNDFKVVFDADSTVGLLPQAIIVNPAARTVKIVSVLPSDNVGSFYASLKLNTPAGSDTASTQLIANGYIPVYQYCTVLSTTAETL
ncbi:hypothetical protein [Deinococcus fonticola]|uniref:hypothetical protein n=1 Tax=Deinococcus fonticola TaxID=2528713 RepID=UPI001074E25C|nr:hypothetical protein [Deinococcus fonticola]